MENINKVNDYFIMSNFFEPFATCEIRINNQTEKEDIYVTYVNKYFAKVTGFPNEEIINKYLSQIYPMDIERLRQFVTELKNTLSTSKFKLFEEYFECCNKFLKIFLFGYNNGMFHAIIEDVTEKRQYKRIILEKNRQISYLIEEMRVKNDRDSLTGLYNYQFAIESLDGSINNYNEYGDKFAVLLIDLLGLSRINEEYGYEIADNVLVDISEMLIANTRKIDVACRYGGDKFLIIYNNVDSDISKILIDRLKISLKKNIMINGEKSICICGSSIDYVGQTKCQLMNDLEQKLQKSKLLGKGIVL